MCCKPNDIPLFRFFSIQCVHQIAPGNHPILEQPCAVRETLDLILFAALGSPKSGANVIVHSFSPYPLPICPKSLCKHSLSILSMYALPLAPSSSYYKPYYLRPRSIIPRKQRARIKVQISIFLSPNFNICGARIAV